MPSLVGSEMCIRDRPWVLFLRNGPVGIPVQCSRNTQGYTAFSACSGDLHRLLPPDRASDSDVSLANLLVAGQLFRASLHHHLAVFQHVTAGRNGEGHTGAVSYTHLRAHE